MRSPVLTAPASPEAVQVLESGLPDPLAGVTSTYDLLGQGAAQHPDATALSFFLRTDDHTRPFRWSHAENLACITRAAHVFHALGIRRGDPVAFILPNLPETHWTIWGAEAVGVAFAINPLLEPAAMAELMRAARPRVLVTLAPTPGSDLWDKAGEAARDVPSLEQVVSVSPLRYLRSPLALPLQWLARWRRPRRLGRLPVHDFHQLLGRAPGDRGLPAPAPTLDDVASYFCTGGTTGLPKIAVRTHRTEVANALQVAAMFGQEMSGPDATVFCGLPLFHVNAQIGTGLAPWAKGAQVLLGTPQGYRAPGLLPRFWELAAHHRFMSFSGVPTVYAALLQHPPDGHDLSALRYGVCGAAPMPLELFERFQASTGIKILEGYGLTEAGCVSTLNPPAGQTCFGSIGIRLPWQPLKAVLIDDEGRYLRDAGVDEVGLLVLRGPNTFQGYLEPSHNRGLWLDLPDGQGGTARWLNTGDLGRQDRQGRFWLAGRRKELIIRGGHNIDPKMIEDALHRHPAVALAAAVGRPDAHAGEVPVAYVQLRPGHEATAEALLAHARDTVSERAAWPKSVEVVGALPTTAIGKIFKPALSLRELERTVRAEADAIGAPLTLCEARQDVKLGALVRWATTPAAAPVLRARLDAYAFRHEEQADAAASGS